MEITLTPEQEAQLDLIANRAGKNSSQVAREILGHVLEQQAYSLHRIQQAEASIERGEFLEHDEVAALIERDFQK